MAFHRGPFAVENAVDTGVAECSIGRELMLAQDAIELRPEPLDAGAAADFVVTTTSLKSPVA